jgi:hypothetical protein
MKPLQIMDCDGDTLEIEDFTDTFSEAAGQFPSLVLSVRYNGQEGFMALNGDGVVALVNWLDEWKRARLPPELPALPIIEERVDAYSAAAH